MKRAVLSDFGITPARLALFVGLAISAAVFESFGMAMLLPVLEYLEKGRDLAVLAGSSGHWKRLVEGFEWLGLPLTLGSLVTGVLGLMLLRIILAFCRQRFIVWLSQEMMHVSRVVLMEACLASRLAFFQSLPTGNVVNLLTNEIQRAASGVTSVLTLSANAVAMGGLLSVLLLVSAPLTVFAMGFLGVAGGVVWLCVRGSKAAGYSASDAYRDLCFVVVERLNAFRLIKLTATNRREGERIRAASREICDHWVRLRTYGAKVDLVMEPVVAAGAMAILYVAVSFFGMSLSEVGLFMLIILRLLPLSQGALREWQSFMSCQGAVSAVRSGLAGARAAAEPPGGSRPFVGLQVGVKLKGVVFAYDGAARATLDGVDLFIPAGRMTALVGPSGAGKSTLVDLLPLLRRPQQGEVLFDGVPAGDYSLDSLRRGIAFVSQEAIIFNDTVRVNLAYVRQDASDAEIWDALDRANARMFVEDTQGGLDTVLGERGASLSGGQRQRIALARALLQGAPVIVLDEPTSSLDSESELAIQNSIQNLRASDKVTLVVIAHRFSTIRRSDKIVVLDHGRVVQEGTHEQLVLNEEWYAKVAAIQSSMEGVGQ